jgi:hypothetical protein
MNGAIRYVPGPEGPAGFSLAFSPNRGGQEIFIQNRWSIARSDCAKVCPLEGSPGVNDDHAARRERGRRKIFADPA